MTITRHTKIACAAVLVMVAIAWYLQPQNSAPAPAYAGPDLAPGDWVLARRFAGSELSQARLRTIDSDYLALRATTAQRAPRAAASAWSFLGPVNIGGRVLDIAVDPQLPDTLFIASASGGVWKSTDAGDTFDSAWPAANAQAIGALAITSGGLLYAGTGESGPGGGSPTFGNQGVFRSADRGASWTNIGLTLSDRISRVVIDPNNEQRLFVAATGPVYAPGGERGVFRSVDGGDSWQLVLPGANATTGASDVYIDPVNPDRVYAVLWDHLRQPSLRRYGGVGSGLFRSLDGGDTWTRLASGLPGAAPDVGRIALGVAPTNPDRLYATYSDDLGFFTTFYVSVNGGDTWVARPFSQDLADSQGRGAYWYARLWIDPMDETRVFSAGVPLLRSSDAGMNWTVDFSVHVDHHAMAWDSKTPGRVYLGNDGGVYRSENNGTDGWVFGSVQPFTQFYAMDVSESNPQRVLGGTQDNRCVRSYSQSNPDDWNQWGFCGDGLEQLVNPLDDNVIYGCSQYGNCLRSINGGETVFQLGSTAQLRRNWQTPLAFDPSDPSVMYYAGERVNRSVDGGGSWATISSDLTGGDPFPTPIDYYPFGTITTLAAAKSDPNTIYVGTDDSRLWVTQDLGQSWTQSTGSNLPQRWVTKVLVDPVDASVAYAAYSGFRNGDDTPYIFKTIDAGFTWTDITGDLPGAPINSLALTQSGTLIAGSDIGVFATIDGGTSWNVVGQDLPQVPVFDLRMHEPSATLFAATFGRGIWSVPLVAEDSDADGVTNAIDNCSEFANPAQVDSDGDNYGNGCDADFNNDCQVNIIDLGEFRQGFFGPDLEFDLTGDGAVNAADLGRLRLLFFQPVGPSGLSKACVPD
ncbi:MAG: glycosyl hydrolase [Gammaproteobacteria bacterium]